MKKVLLLVVLAGGLLSCKRNPPVPTSHHQAEEALGQYLFGPLSFQNQSAPNAECCISNPHFC